MVTKFSSKRYGILKQFHRAYLEYFSSVEKLPFYHSPKIHFIRHHLAHAASAFYISPFEKANIISLDGGGGEESGLLLYGEGNKMKIIKRNSSASSWGFLYSYVTQFLGFKSDADEGKVMGLAAYGKPKVKVFPFINFKKVIPEFDLVGFSNYFRNMKSRKPGEPIGEFHKNLAATLQNRLDEVVLKMVKYPYRINGVNNFCIAGGVGLNCTTNSLGQQEYSCRPEES